MSSPAPDDDRECRVATLLAAQLALLGVLIGAAILFAF